MSATANVKREGALVLLFGSLVTFKESVSYINQQSGGRYILRNPPACVVTVDFSIHSKILALIAPNSIVSCSNSFNNFSPISTALNANNLFTPKYSEYSDLIFGFRSTIKRSEMRLMVALKTLERCEMNSDVSAAVSAISLVADIPLFLWKSLISSIQACIINITLCAADMHPTPLVTQ